MAVVLPKSWCGTLTRHNRGALSFDARTVDARNGRAHDAFDLIEITGSGRTVQSDVAGPGAIVPGDSWSTYRLPLTAKRFGVSETDWNRILGDVTKIVIRMEGYAGANETMGLDNVSLQAP